VPRLKLIQRAEFDPLAFVLRRSGPTTTTILNHRFCLRSSITFKWMWIAANECARGGYLTATFGKIHLSI